MNVDCFLDTNVIFYAAMAQASDPAKYERAKLIMTETHFGISAQVLQEFYANVVRKTARPLTHLEALEFLRTLVDRPIVNTDYDLILEGAEIADRYKITYWDGAILAAAQRLRAPVVYSEDLSHGQIYGSIRVENPFRTH